MDSRVQQQIDILLEEYTYLRGLMINSLRMIASLKLQTNINESEKRELETCEDMTRIILRDMEREVLSEIRNVAQLNN